MQALVIGAGPAGLMAAEVLAQGGARVTLAEAKPSPARKFLMAGKSGLNLTKVEPDFAAAYRCAPLDPMLAAFGPDQVMEWARGLGQEVFAGSTGRVFPVAMKGSPLLRAWLGRLAALGVTLHTRWRWVGIENGMVFDTPEGRQVVTPDVTILALGGASWARLGSDGAWTAILAPHVGLAPFAPANFGLNVTWSPHMARHFGQAVKGAALCLPDRRERGEFVIASRGLEGGGLYAISRDIRAGAQVTLDLFPDLSPLALEARIARLKPGDTMPNRLRKLGLSAPAAALVMEWGRALPLMQALKSLPMVHQGPRPMDEAISTAGGVDWAALDGLRLRALPRVFVTGEMVDWEAPTGGYLLTACLAMGAFAARQALGQTPLAIS
ncbi:TIGR03862 family flavoprotein [Rhodobacter sp. KR11]|uniref:TIGR03862 family flavoprotein n=1 Tax=Rhodobacter sp. KR11 TaxID=2974588 RepID=UPI0022214AE0|nr:TIGR03862 family flavoprotein [Rhodobacter sp. KR11]MCW1917260.1 TIGR03862 family flavoprotein [Rhodobacter sp. KR11]